MNIYFSASYNIICVHTFIKVEYNFKEVIFLNNVDMNQLLNMISKMDKKDLEESINRANQIMNSSDKQKIIDAIKNKKRKLITLKL